MTLFKRKIYEEMKQWKARYDGNYALLIKGARRVGKSTIVEEFARTEYKSFILIDFSNVSPDINALFNDMYDLDFFFMQLQQLTKTKLYERESVIIFDEVQLQPLARQAIKHLVKDRRYDYIETGSLLSIKKNVQNILIPSEEHKVSMYPLDFEEFLTAIGDDMTWDMITQAYRQKKPLGDAVHRRIMRIYRLYMLVGGMPQAVEVYLRQNYLGDVDMIKREIIELYLDDFSKIDNTGFAASVFEMIPAELSRNTSRFSFSGTKKRSRVRNRDAILADMRDSYTINTAWRVDDPNVGMSMTIDPDSFKLFTLDTGIFVSLAFRDKAFTENVIYDKILTDKLSVNLGYVFENAVSQELVSHGNRLYYHSMRSDTSNHIYEVDFILTQGKKIAPIEVKSSSYRTHTSLDRFCEKYASRIGERYVIHTKDYKREGGTTYLPVYMVGLL